jgi:hypothetical protein
MKGKSPFSGSGLAQLMRSFEREDYVVFRSEKTV